MSTSLAFLRMYKRFSSRYGPRLRDAAPDADEAIKYQIPAFVLNGNLVHFAAFKSQNLRIKRFFGTSENAVKTQVWISVSVYVIVAIVRKRLGLSLSLHTMLQILSVTPFEKQSLIDLLKQAAILETNADPGKQLNLL